MRNFPNQYTTKKDKQWMKDSIDAVIERLSTNSLHYQRHDFRDMYDGIVGDHVYKDVLKPFGKERKNMGKVRNYNIVKPLVDVLVGEKQKRPINEMVLSANADSTTSYEKAKYEQFKKIIFQKYQAVMSGQKDTTPKNYEEFEKEFDGTYRDERSVRGQHALNYIKYAENLEYKIKSSFKSFLVEGVVAVLIDVRDDDLYIEFPDPLRTYWDQNAEFFEDGSYAMIREYGNWQGVTSKYGKEIQRDYGEDVLLDLQKSNGYSRNESVMLGSDRDNGSSITESERNIENEIEVFRVFWKSFKKVGIVTGQNEQGLYEREVDYPYSKLPEEQVEWSWEEQVWQGICIDNRYYVDCKPCPVQRSYVSKQGCKLPLNGKVYADHYNRPISLISICKPYQIMFNVYMYRLERAVEKARDTIAVFDINFIPDEFEDFDEFFYWIDKTGVAFVDYNKEDYRGSTTHQSYIDLTVKNIQSYIQLLQFMLQSVEQITGINQQRKGQVGAYSGKGTTERAVIQSSHVTEDYFFKFEEFQKRTYQALLDYSKGAWLEGKKIHYIGDDNKNVFYELDGIQHLESDYNIHVSNNIRDVEDLETLRSLSQAMIQNGVPLSLVAETVRAKNFAVLKDTVRDMEAEIGKREQAMQEAEQQRAEAEMKTKQAEIELKKEEMQLKANTDLEKARIANEDNTAALEMKKHQDDLELEKEKLEEEKRSNKAKEEIERIKANKTT